MGSNLAVLFCVLVGVLISTLPHLIGQIRFGEPVYFADFDDTILYLNYGAHAYHNDVLRLLDPVQKQPTGVFAPWIQLIPGAIFAKVFSVPPIFITLVYRIFAGVFVAIAAYLFIFSFVRKSIPAAALTTIFLTDAGQRTAYILLKQVKASLYLLMGRGQEVISSVPDLMLHWRIITPALSIAFLLAHFWAVSEMTRQKPWNRAWLVFAGVSYGLLFHVYFYYWTATTIALGLMLILNRERWKEWFVVGTVGVIIGIPALLLRMSTKAAADPEWLFRNAFFLPMENRLAYFMFPKFLILIAIAGVVYWVIKKEKDLLYLLCVGLASIFLLNQRIITGLENHDNHWLYIGAPAMYLLGILMIYRLLEQRNWGRAYQWGICGLAFFMLVTGIGLRAAEATMAGDSKLLMNSYQVVARYAADLEKVSFKPRTTAVGTEPIVSFLSTKYNLRPFSGLVAEISPRVSTTDWNRRMAANAVLTGSSEYDFKIDSHNRLILGGWNWPQAWRERSFEERMRFFREYNESPEKILDDYDFAYVAIGPRHKFNDQLAVSPRFRKALTTATLKIWERLE